MTNSTIRAEREQQARQQRWAAREQMEQHHKDVVKPQIEQAVNKLYHRLMVEPLAGSAWNQHGPKSKPVIFTATLDCRSQVLDPDHPYPDIKPRQYRVYAQENYYDHPISIHAYWWDSGARRTTANDRWQAICSSSRGWYYLQVLNHLLEKIPAPQPETWMGAMDILIRKMQSQRCKLTPLEQAALLTLEDHQRDPATRGPSYNPEKS